MNLWRVIRLPFHPPLFGAFGAHGCASNGKLTWLGLGLGLAN